MATVYEASDALTGERVAAKVLHRIHLGRTEIRQRFEFEARLTEGLEHPNATIECLLTRPPTPIATLCPTLPQGLSSVVHRALAFYPGERYATIEDLARALAPYAGQGFES